MDFAIFDCHILDLNDEEMKYINDQLVEAVTSGGRWAQLKIMIRGAMILPMSPYCKMN